MVGEQRVGSIVQSRKRIVEVRMKVRCSFGVLGRRSSTSGMSLNWLHSSTAHIPSSLLVAVAVVVVGVVATVVVAVAVVRVAVVVVVVVVEV